MIKEAKAIGATVEEARDKALAKLGAGLNDDVQYEVISRPKKKVLGIFGGAPAEVRVFIELPDEKPRRKPQQKNAADKHLNPAAVETVKEEKKHTDNNEKQFSLSDQSCKRVPAISVAEEMAAAVDASELASDSQAKKAIDYISDILRGFGYENITAKAAELERGAFISFGGEDMGAVIGRHGETIDAIQYLAGLAASNESGYYKISLNFGDYREKREQTLNALTERICEQVIKSGRSRAMEPMNPYERRVVHTAVQKFDGIISGSVGEGSNRRVVIAPEGTEIRQNGRPYGSGKGNRRSQGRSRFENGRSSVVTTPTREPKKDTELPLYGKIN